MTEARTAADDRQLRRFWMLVALGAVAAGIAATSGMAWWLANPADGTAPDDVLGIVAAASGLLTGALFGLAAIYAQIKNLWRFAPMWFRYTAWGVMAVIAVVAIVSGSLRSSS